MADAAAYVGGVALALTSVTCNATGLLLQKLAHKRRDDARHVNCAAAPRAVIREPQWLLGIGCMAVGSALSFAVFTLLGQSAATTRFQERRALAAGCLGGQCECHCYSVMREDVQDKVGRRRWLRSPWR